MSQIKRIALATAISFLSIAGVAHAADLCSAPADPVGTPCADDGNPCTNDLCDGANTCLHTDNTAPCDDGQFCTTYDTCNAGQCVGGTNTCTEMQGVGKNGGYFRVTVPQTWDGDLVLVNHGFDLNGKHIRPHNVCGNNSSQTCEDDTDCTGTGNFCNKISYMGVDEILLPMGKAVAAGTYSQTGWAVFGSAKDLKDIISYAKKAIPAAKAGAEVKRVIATGFSLGGAVTADAVLKLKLDGAVPLCGAVGGGLPTWDVAQDVRLVYDFLCDGVGGAKFNSAPDMGEPNTPDSTLDARAMALSVDACFGVIGYASHTPEMDTRLAEFIALTGFTGYQGPNGGLNVAGAMGFATLGLGDFVRDANRLKNARIGLNDTLDYSVIGTDPMLALTYDAAVKRLTAGKGRKKLAKVSNPDFMKGKPAKVAYPILSMAGANDWLVIPEFQRVFDTALTDGSKKITQTWIDTFGHCVFTPEETTAVYNKYFQWIGLHAGDTPGAQPTPAEVHAECLAIGGIEGDTCNFNDGYVPGNLFDRIPKRADWPAAATH